MFQYFSWSYDVGLQTKFERFLEAGNLFEARNVLERMPRGQDQNEQSLRALIVGEGYKALYEKLSSVVGSTTSINSRLERVNERTETDLTVETALEVLRGYQEINPDLQDLKEELEKLKKYQERGQPEELIRRNPDLTHALRNH